MKFRIVQCYKCGYYQATPGKKSITCKRCGKKIYLHRAKIIAIVEDAFTATEIVKKLNAKYKQ